MQAVMIKTDHTVCFQNFLQERLLVCEGTTVTLSLKTRTMPTLCHQHNDPATQPRDGCEQLARGMICAVQRSNSWRLRGVRHEGALRQAHGCIGCVCGFHLARDVH